MPQMGISEESAILTVWHVAAGDTVAVGDKLFSIETGKSAFDIESEFSGTVLGLIAAEGDEILIKDPVCAIGEAGESFEAKAGQTAPTAPAATTAAPVQATPAVAAAAASAPAGSGAGVSPRARHLAEKAGVDPATAGATGPEGRVIERDIRALIESGVQAPRAQAAATTAAAASGAGSMPPSVYAFADAPMSNLRKVIAKNMMASLQNTAQLTHTASFDATQLMAMRATVKNIQALAGITLGDFVLYAVSRTLPEFPALNSWLVGDTLRTFDEVNLAVAVDTDKGLMVPVIPGASNLSVLDISNEVKTLADGCRNGSAPPDRLTGGSFTVSNLGGYGIESFTPILNAPQTGILGVNTITQRVRAGKDGALELYPSMSLSLTYDHRAVDGAPASRFLQTLCRNLENIESLVLKSLLEGGRK